MEFVHNRCLDLNEATVPLIFFHVASDMLNAVGIDVLGHKGERERKHMI
jgi:hypothetical protein